MREPWIENEPDDEPEIDLTVEDWAGFCYTSKIHVELDRPADFDPAEIELVELFDELHEGWISEE